MSLPQQHKTNESKAKSKFQSLNINTLYQGAANKATSKNLPQKHGLQSLGKVPTARRAPANLPSVKSEKGGNDPTVVLVPTGGAGWAKDGEKPPGGVEEKKENNSTSSAAQDAKKEPPVAAKPSGPKSWSSVTGAAQSAAPPGQNRPQQQQAFLHQKSPLFGQEFPSLRTGEVGMVKSGSPENQPEMIGNGVAGPAAAASKSQLEQSAGKDGGEPERAVPAYGPGPSLRPQTFGNWTQGGVGKPGAGVAADSSPGDAVPPLLPPQPHKPTPPGSSLGPSRSPPPRGNPANQYKSIMPPFMDVMELPTAPPEFLGSRRGGGGGRERGPPAARREPPRGGNSGGGDHHRQHQTTDFVPPSIIDTEKLRRMDDLADDWTYDDENFDYNKRLQSDDEENDAMEPSSSMGRPDPNWADQVERTIEHHHQMSPAQSAPPPYNYYEDMKKSAVGFVLDEEERRRNKKSEEVMKNIERARQRREEEENRYRRSGSEEYSRNEDRLTGGGGGRRFDESSKENKAPLQQSSTDRRDWAYEEKNRRPKNVEDRREARFDERQERSGGGDRYDTGRRDGGYYAPRFERRDREERGRRDEFRRDEPLFDSDYKQPGGGGGQHGFQAARPVSRDRGGRGGFEDRGGRAGLWEEETSFEDAGRIEDKRKPERRRRGRSPVQTRRDSEKSYSGSPEAGLDSGHDWMGRGAKPLTDWANDVEKGDGMEKFDLDAVDHREKNRPSRPTSRDSRVSRDSQGSKQSKGSRNSGDKLGRKMGDYAAEPKEQRKFERDTRSARPLIQDYDLEKKAVPAPARKPQASAPQQQMAPTDLRGYFRDGPIEEKKMGRTAPGPITREKLEAAEAREQTGMTQLRKRDAKLDIKPAEPEEMDKQLAPLVDSDLLENISEDEDALLEGSEREDRGGQLGSRSGRGRHRGGGQQQQVDPRRQQQQQPFMGRGGAPGGGGRGERGANRGGPVRGGRSGRGGSGRWPENDVEAEESEEAKKNRKNREDKVGETKFSHPPPQVGFTLRGQPSRRGRGGENRGRIGGVGPGQRWPGMDGAEPGAEEAGDWGDEEAERKNRGGGGGGSGSVGVKPMPPRMQRRREELGRPRHQNKEAEAGDAEDWETASENSNDDAKRFNTERQRAADSDRGQRGGVRGKGWEPRGGRRGGGPGGQGGPSPGGAQQFGGGHASVENNAREQTPESAEGFKKRTGIENFDLHDYASVVVVDQGGENFIPDHEFEGMEGAGEFMQVVNRKVRLPLPLPPPPPPPSLKEDRRSFERQGPKMGEKVAYNDYKYRDYSKEAYDKKINKNSFDRRQSKLPPRLAKQREVSRAQAMTGMEPTGMEANGWPEGDKMGVFQVEDLGTTAWEKPPTRRDKDGVEVSVDMRSSPKVEKENSGIQQTMVFENTALKSVKSGDKIGLEKGGIQLPMGGSKPEDAVDLKLDFTFGGDDLSGGQGKAPMSMPRALPHLAANQGLPASPSTDDMSAKLTNIKKLWDAPGMAVVQENTSVAGSSSWNDVAAFNDNFEGFQENNQIPDGGAVYVKNENGGVPVNNVAKVKPQQQHLSMDPDNRPNPMQYNRMANNGMPGAIPSPPTQMGQMGPLQAQPWAFQHLERTSPMYNPYGASQLSQSILMAGAHSMGTDLFTGSNGAGGYRLQGAAGHYAGSQQNPTNNVLISQANLLSGGVKHSNQIGPIGTKAGTGASSSPYLQSGLGPLPNTFIQYDAGNYNYVNPNAAGMQRGNAPPSQTAFYQTLASRQQPQLALNALQGNYNHAMSQQQMRAANHVTGLPYMKSDLGGIGQPNKTQLNENFGPGPNNYNNGRSQGGPPSPKTKLKMEQQHQQQAAAKMAGMSSMNNLNNLRHVAQVQMNSLGYNVGMSYSPSPIARPQIAAHGGVPHMGPGKGNDYYTVEGGDDKMEGEGEAARAGGQEGCKEGEGGPEEQEAPPPGTAAAAPHL